MRASLLPTQAQATQRGAAMMIMIVIMVVGIITILVGALSSSALQSARVERTSNALAQAKDALIGRAVSDENMPGSLPCPDTDDDGSSELLTGNHCPSYIGRLPWRTLGLPDLRDGSGERLWYALSPAFRDDDAARPLNSNTKGTLLIYGTDGATAQTAAGYDAVAVIFAPGSPLSTGSPIRIQTRITVAQKIDAANYLDGANSRDNTTATPTSAGPFIAGAKSPTFNDQLLLITTKDVIPLVEQRVAAEVITALTLYRTLNGYYPWADSVPSSSDYDANAGLNRGWLPDSAAVGGGNPTPDWDTSNPPSWFFANEWYTLIYYSLAKNRKPPGSCTSCIDNSLTVDGTNGVGAVFFMPGTPIGTLVRSAITLPDYLETQTGLIQNNDNADDRYVTPASTDKDRDRIYLMP